MTSPSSSYLTCRSTNHATDGKSAQPSNCNNGPVNGRSFDVQQSSRKHRPMSRSCDVSDAKPIADVLARTKSSCTHAGPNDRSPLVVGATHVRNRWHHRAMGHRPRSMVGMAHSPRPFDSVGNRRCRLRPMGCSRHDTAVVVNQWLQRMVVATSPSTHVMNDNEHRSHPFRIEWVITQRGHINLIAPDYASAIDHARTMLGVTQSEHIAIVEVVQLDDDDDPQHR